MLDKPNYGAPQYVIGNQYFVQIKILFSKFYILTSVTTINWVSSNTYILFVDKK